ncbi:hypothetical protein LTR10_020059 [Elasticomyces elasticus]|uniref:CFEM domain-containing protein n=1 Tax=Exophiala sideris TaxID=1016849 RepID=A0ABR0IVA0_9EURO|nr:hypothetical protein LTR10_020059 [Elasticomyces elasticus]KAK5021359.1 hypothetical protein LTS07_011102 [Exophiala sideris]KAK5024307.1 hypothetical protein LTR13_010928 [Exophiala sideris]KAK5049250.1 hypothetical protein LTR69_011125 [Exophiala sideris]KAK5176562.1 hypothetical protein LTR44_010950 [Eurotiomycetes sp. CCFEE 6388]
MRHSALVLSFILGLAQLSSSQLSGLPACAQDAANAAAGASGCSSSDITCLCNSPAFKTAISTTILQACGTADVDQALVWAETTCGPTLTDAASAGTSSTMTGSPSGSAAMAVASTTTVPTTLTSMTSIAGATATGAMVSAALASSGSSMQSNMTTTMMNGTACSAYTPTSTMAATAPAMYTGAAVSVKAGQGVMAVVMGVVGAVALL